MAFGECPHEAQVRRFVANALGEPDRSDLERHLQACNACRRRADELTKAQSTTLASPPDIPALAQESESPPDVPGYQVLDVLGRGGMGVIWRARDPRLGRFVAIKVSRSRIGVDAEVVYRFKLEAQIIAQLAHPGIVPVHDVGELADGRPYYCMKIVDGHTLAELLDRSSGTLHETMEQIQVFSQVCQAIAYAHEQNVIHRDLKPNNIMVGHHGEVQVMDWGLAKILAAPTEDTHPLLPLDRQTGVGDPIRTQGALGTPAYLPPEQARGETNLVDRRSDVFGLGAILCKILTGKPPYAQGSGVSQAREGDLGDAYERLERCGADRELVELARQCLDPSADQRPADAGQVSQRVSDYLAGVRERLQQERVARESEQLLAREERKRRKLWFGLAMSLTVAALLLVVGLIVVNWLRREEMAAREASEQSRRQTWTVLDDISSTMIENWLGRQPHLTREHRDFLQRTLNHYERLAAGEEDSTRNRAMLAHAYRYQGLIRLRLGLKDFEPLFDKSLELSRQLRDEHPSVDLERNLATSYHNLAIARRHSGDYDEALRLTRLAADCQRRILKEHPEDAEAQQDLGTHLTMLGGYYRITGELSLATEALDEGVRFCQSALDQVPGTPDATLSLARAHYMRAVIYTDQQQLGRARDEMDRAIELLETTAGSSPENDLLELLANCYSSQNDILTQLDQRDEAIAVGQQAIEVLDRLVARFPTVGGYRNSLAAALNNQFIVCEDLGRMGEAESVVRSAIELREKVRKATPDDVENLVFLGSNYGNYGHFLRNQRRFPEALENFAKSVQCLEPWYGQDATARQFLKTTYLGRAEALDLMLEYEQAVLDWDRALELEDGDQRLWNQARRALSLGDHAEAVRLADEQTQGDVGSNLLHKCSRVCGWAAARVAPDDPLHEQYADRCVELLARAVAAGFQNLAFRDVRTDPAFDAVRNRADFQQCVDKLVENQAWGPSTSSSKP